MTHLKFVSHSECMNSAKIRPGLVLLHGQEDNNTRNIALVRKGEAKGLMQVSVNSDLKKQGFLVLVIFKDITKYKIKHDETCQSSLWAYNWEAYRQSMVDSQFPLSPSPNYWAAYANVHGFFFWAVVALSSIFQTKRLARMKLKVNSTILNQPIMLPAVPNDNDLIIASLSSANWHTFKRNVGFNRCVGFVLNMSKKRQRNLDSFLHRQPSIQFIKFKSVFIKLHKEKVYPDSSFNHCIKEVQEHDEVQAKRPCCEIPSQLTGDVTHDAVDASFPAESERQTKDGNSHASSAFSDDTISWLNKRSMSFCVTTEMWWPVYVEGEGLFYLLCKKHDTSNPQNETKVFNKEPCK
ncbi:unnamed protein product [Porites lobata]|uniref:Uncharacterized protein n=1 Tax=Porites lobata TaxID=104759 RepID=A0ABN8RKC9_9CNID|nr:unnamed protein product [Porites lobata]